VNLGDCFLEYSYFQSIVLVNDTEFCASFTLDEKDDSNNLVYSFEFERSSGVIEPFSNVSVNIEIRLKRIGLVSFPIFLRIHGNDDFPLALNVTANGIGAEVTVDKNEIDWEKVPVLTTVPRDIILKNMSPIPASIFCSMVNDKTCFRIEPAELIIQPGKQCKLYISAYLDDTTKFSDVLRIETLSSKTHEILLSARGTGNTVVFDEGLKNYHFNDVFSNRECSTSFTFYNKGRKTQHLNWLHASTKDPNILATQIFEVIPSRFILKPGAHQVVFFKGYSHLPMKIIDKVSCFVTADKSPLRKLLVESTLSVEFISPLLQISPTSLNFKSTHTNDDSFNILTQTLSLSNTSSLSVTVSLKCPKPYFISAEDNILELKAGEVVSVNVSFDPSHNLSRISTKENGVIQISYKEHPQKDSILLHSEIFFPNLTFNTNQLQFGCIPNNLEQKKSFTMKNTSSLPVIYDWYFLSDENYENCDISQAFDFKPLRGTIQPNETESVDVYFYGHIGSKIKASAICNVAGGPKYELILGGEASDYKFAFDKTELDFGIKSYQTITEDEIMLTNVGNVAFDFLVKIFTKTGLADKCMVYPANGTILKGGKQKFTVRFTPFVPENVSESFYIQIAHFEPTEIKIKAETTFPSILYNIPREANTLAKRQYKFEFAVENFYENDRCYLRDVIKDYFDQQSKVSTNLVPSTTQNFVGSSILFSKGSFAKNSKDQKLASLNESSAVLQGTYICDFGTCIKNTLAKKIIIVTNTGLQSITFSLSKSALNNTGFLVEPEKVKNIPIGESIEIVATFLAKSDEPKVEVELPIYVLGGPTHVIKLIARIAVPTVCLAEERTLEFGEVVTGHRKSMILQLHNPSAITSEWVARINSDEGSSLKPKLNALKDFDMVPSSGSLQPFEKLTVLVRFSPAEQKSYDMNIPLKVTMNSKLYQIRVTGTGIIPLLVFDPPSLVLGPILPFSEGSECRITLHNPTKHSLEVYSVDYDSNYRQEQEVLRQFEGFDNGILYLQPKESSINYMDFFLDQQKKRHLVSATVGDINKFNMFFTNSATETQPTADIFTNIILHGPPFSGRSLQSKKIAMNFNKKIVTLDEIVEGSALYAEKKLSNINMNSLSLEEDNRQLDECKSYFSEEVVVDLFKQYFASIYVSNFSGIVLNGLDCKYCSNIPFILKNLIKQLLEKGRKLLFFHLTLELSKIREREFDFQAISTEQEINLLRVKELSEEEYDVLNEPDKIAYDDSLLKYRKKIKEIETRRIKERRFNDGDANARLGDRKNLEDRKGKERRPTHFRTPLNEKAEKLQTPVINKAIKKPASPKLTKKLSPEKNEKHVEKELKHIDKDFQEVPLSEIEFIKEITYKKVENYISTLDSTLSILKDGKDQEKIGAPVKPITGPTQASEKKTKLTKGAQNEPVIANIPDENIILEEIPFPELHEFNSSVLDEENLFRALSEFIPGQLKEEDTNYFLRHLNECFMEKSFAYPVEKDRIGIPKAFSIVSIASPMEVEDITTEVIQAPVASKPTDSKPEKGDSKKGSKAVKQPDDKNLELEEDVEKEQQNTYRWVINGGEKREFVVRFNPLDAAKFETNLNFELIGGGESFQLPCTGYCEYSQIITEYKRIFSKVRKTKEERGNLQGEFVLSSSTYEFGPLLYNKPKDKYQDSDNRASFNIINPGTSEIKVDFALKNDVKADTFSFEPQSITLAPGKSQTVNVAAFPKIATYFEDTFIISILDNPEPFLFKISCIGVKPELEIDRKTLAFDRLLLGRSDRKEFKLKNPTYMPVSWKITGLESLGDEFVITPTEGQVESFGDMTVIGEYRAMKSLLVKKMLKLEISDVDKIAGVVQEIPILVTAESYDTSMDVHFPKGLEGGLDFGTLKVFEEGKQLVTLRNKGKYEVGFRFLFDAISMTDLISISPPQGLIQPSEKPFFVQIVVKSSTEITLKDFPTLKCIVFETSTGEVTASIPVKISVRAVFSKFSVLPVRDLNFGALVHGTRPSKQFVIENSGEFDFKYSIFKLIARVNDQKNVKPTSKMSSKVRALSPPPTSKIMNKKDALKQGDVVSFGSFSVFPTNGIIQTGSKQIITVDFHADVAGIHEEIIGIDITDRAPGEHNDVLEYQLIGESCIPGINTIDFISIFEEQSICKHLELFKTQSFVYSEEDRVFFYGAYLAGQQTQVQFKISNPFKVPCDVTLSTKSRGKAKTEASDFAFDVEPKKLSIPSHEHRYVSVSFHPTSIQNYSGVFEALVENVTDGKYKCLTFELRGEGTLPRVSIEKPILRSKAGFPWVKFRRLLIGTNQIIPIVLKNDGIIPANVKIEWGSKDNEDFICSSLNSYHNLKPGEVRSVDVKCQPSLVKKFEGELKLKVQDNNFEDSIITVTGEGFLDDFTIDSFGDDIENEIAFLDCYIGETKTVSFKVRNHSSDWIKASFAESADFTFSPSVFHIRPEGGERDISVTFCPKQPILIQHVVVLIKVMKIKFAIEPELEWDERMKMVKWGTAGNLPPKKVIENIIEPIHETITNLNDYQILMNASSDYSSYECDVSSIQFKSTFMYQNRVFRFPLRNNGKISLQFSFELFEDENLLVEIDEGTFSINPSSGKIQPGEMIMVAVKFSPTDVGLYRAVLQGIITNLQRDQKCIQIGLSAGSLRPYCHFELDDIDPHSIESRTPERCQNNGVPYVLDPHTKIIEFSSCGVKVKTIKRFYIVNPTQTSYEFQWKLESNDSKTFKCMTPKGTVAPNKKSEIIFEFQSDNIETKVQIHLFRNHCGCSLWQNVPCSFHFC
jgi:hypothetical protein